MATVFFLIREAVFRNRLEGVGPSSAESSSVMTMNLFRFEARGFPS
jgi:hypothetical protein